MKSTFFEGEAFPCHWLSLGSVPMSAYFGGTPFFKENTVWYDTCFRDWDAAKTRTFNSENRWWKLTLELTTKMLEYAQRRYFISGCSLGGLVDVIANLWGIGELHGIQWVPGAGVSNDPMDWLDFINRIQAGGKKVILSCPPSRVKDILRHIGRRLVYLNIQCRAESETLSCIAQLDQIVVWCKNENDDDCCHSSLA